MSCLGRVTLALVADPRSRVRARTALAALALASLGCVEPIQRSYPAEGQLIFVVSARADGTILSITSVLDAELRDLEVDDDDTQLYLVGLDRMSVRQASPYLDADRLDQTTLVPERPLPCKLGEVETSRSWVRAALPPAASIRRLDPEGLREARAEDLPFTSQLTLRIPVDLGRCDGDSGFQLRPFLSEGASRPYSNHVNRILWLGENAVMVLDARSLFHAERRSPQAGRRYELSTTTGNAVLTARSGESRALVVSYRVDSPGALTAFLDELRVSDPPEHVSTTTIGPHLFRDVAARGSDTFVLAKDSVQRLRSDGRDPTPLDLTGTFVRFRTGTGPSPVDFVVTDSNIYAGSLERDQWAHWNQDPGFRDSWCIEDVAETRSAGAAKTWAAGNFLAARTDAGWESRDPLLVAELAGTTAGACGIGEVAATIERIAAFPADEPTHLALLLDNSAQLVVYRIEDGCAVAVGTEIEAAELVEVSVGPSGIAVGGATGALLELVTRGE
ncbi:MAG: hypothetical protein HYV07_29800 [Deltaproteobacteria bacterium]|nr:hypothetical protein [Deltaproteobacteria bacterium]